MAQDDFPHSRQEPRWIESDLPQDASAVPGDAIPSAAEVLESISPAHPRPWRRWLWLLVVGLLLLCIGLVLMVPWAIGLVLQLRMQEWVASAQTSRSSVRVVSWSKDMQWLKTAGQLQVQIVSDCSDAANLGSNQSTLVLDYQVSHLPTLYGWGQAQWSLQPAGADAASKPAWRATGNARLDFDGRVKSGFTMTPREFMWLGVNVHIAPVQGNLDWSDAQLLLQLHSDQWDWQNSSADNSSAPLAWTAKGLALQVQARMRTVDGVSRLDAEVTPSLQRMEWGRNALQNLRFALEAKDVYWPSVRQFIAAGEGSCGFSATSKRQLAAIDLLLKSGLQLGLVNLQASSVGSINGKIQGGLQLALQPAADGVQDLANRLQLDANLSLQGPVLSSEQFQSALASGVAVPLGQGPDDGLAFKMRYQQGQLLVADKVVDKTYLALMLQQTEAQLHAWIHGQVAPIVPNPLTDRPPPQPSLEE